MSRAYADTKCPECDGTGSVEAVTVTGWGAGWHTCTHCDGEGSI